MRSFGHLTFTLLLVLALLVGLLRCGARARPEPGPSQDGGAIDTVPPRFAGAAGATVEGTAVVLSWLPAIDDVDPPEALVYRVYPATSAGGQDFARPAHVSAPGAQGLTVVGLAPATRYFFVVRALDSSGNEDANTHEVEATTEAPVDIAPPSFAGLAVVEPLSPTSVQLSWAPASDDVSAPSAIVYDVYVSGTTGGQDFATPTATTPGGATGYRIDGLAPNQQVFVVVRARDEAGNQDGNLVERSALTPPDTTAPNFAGVSSAVASGPTTVALSWSAGADDVSPAGKLVYRVYAAASAGGQDFTQPFLSTAPGATSATVSDLSPSTRYHFVVRAVDEAGNEDANTAERSALTAADTTAPSFGGAGAVSGATGTSLEVSWTQAVDDTSAPAQIQYLVCHGTTASACTTSFTASALVTGVTAYTATGLAPGTTYYFVVRARDAFGNTEQNTVVRSGTTLADGVPPSFAGATAVSSPTETSLKVEWSAAVDDSTPSASIDYLVCRSTSSTGCATSFSASAIASGVTSYTATGLAPGTTYHFVVRARDGSGNVDANTVTVAGATLADTVPPTGGEASAVTDATASSLWVHFTQAADDVAAAAELRYRICWRADSEPSSNCTTDFAANVRATVVGSPLHHVATGLSLGTTYHFVVRAEDPSGNRSSNTVSVSGATLDDATPPVWIGGPTVVRSDAVAGRLSVSWTAASDNKSGAGQLRYQLCWSTTAVDCTGSAFTSLALTAPGATSHDLDGLATRTEYFVFVRAEDAAGNVETGDHSASATTATSYSQDVAPRVFDGPCASCHGWSYASTVNQPSAFSAGSSCGDLLDYVEPFAPERSYLFRKLNPSGASAAPFTASCPNVYDGDQMPQGGPYDDALITLMREWIEQGAHDN